MSESNSGTQATTFARTSSSRRWAAWRRATTAKFWKLSPISASTRLSWASSVCTRAARSSRRGQQGGVVAQAHGAPFRRLVQQVVGQGLVEHQGTKVKVASGQGLDEELGFSNRRSLQRAHHHESGAVVEEQPLDGACPLDEARIHGLEEDEELGDVLEELRAKDPVCDLIEGPRRHVHDPAAIRAR